MPHKQKRKAQHLRGNGAEANYDLAPTERARALPVGKAPQKNSKKPSSASNGDAATNGAAKTKGKKPKQKLNSDNDTPRAFTRLLNLQSMREQKKRKSLGTEDENTNSSTTTTTQQPSKKKQRLDTKESTASKQSSSDPLRIQPKERLSDFAARVDHALPLSGLARRNRSVSARAIPGLQERQTKMEKRLQRMHAEWRVEDAKIKEREAEMRDAQELEDAENGIFRERSDDEDNDNNNNNNNNNGTNQEAGNGKKKKKKKGGKKKVRVGLAGEDEDPWAILKTRHPASAGLHDVVQAPPTFSKVPSEKFKTYQGAKVAVGDVPSASGSLRRREELGSARRQIIEHYRAKSGPK